MIGRPKKSKAGSVVSSSVRKLVKGLTKEEQISKKILEHFKEKSLRIARDIEPALYAKEFKFYEKARESFDSEMKTLESQRNHYLSSTSKRRKQEKLQKISGDKFRLIFKITVQAIKLAMPYYYESDLYRFIALSKLSPEQTVKKLQEFLYTPFSYSMSFIVKTLIGRSTPQLNYEHLSTFVYPLLSLTFKQNLDPQIKVFFL